MNKRIRRLITRIRNCYYEQKMIRRYNLCGDINYVLVLNHLRKYTYPRVRKMYS